MQTAPLRDGPQQTVTVRRCLSSSRRRARATSGVPAAEVIADEPCRARTEGSRAGSQIDERRRQNQLAARTLFTEELANLLERLERGMMAADPIIGRRGKEERRE